VIDTLIEPEVARGKPPVECATCQLRTFHPEPTAL